MRFFMTFFWSFLLVQMMAYVVSSMSGGVYDFKIATVLSVVVTVLIFIIAEVIPVKEHSGEQH
ncbi:YjzD family protein [Metabacillus fastidiosus]|uniref:YjzD family protein n=1 Tax=Metabacillus fastidiosus TaxID=1458 RepID=UPI002E1C96D5|nr:YjzD family protein [Metabacillus fastidiosus]